MQTQVTTTAYLRVNGKNYGPKDVLSTEDVLAIHGKYGFERFAKNVEDAREIVAAAEATKKTAKKEKTEA